jgi:hypothetical protein
MTESSDRYVKVLFEVPEKDGSASVETLWAIDLGADQCRLDNSPFYAYSVSWQDVVYAPFDVEQGFRTFQRVVSKGGHRTLRVLFDAPLAPGNQADKVLKGLVDLGCGYEGAASKYFSINLPPAADLQKVRAYLIEIGATWEHADPTYAELFPGDKS